MAERRSSSWQSPSAHWLALALLVLTTSCTVGFGPPRLLDRPIAPQEQYTLGELQAWAASQAPPTLSARAVTVYDATGDQLLLAKEANLPLPPASLTKLMTALLVLERGELTRTVTIAAADLVGGASMGLRAGERVTVEDLLWGLLIPSGNDAALALARTHAGRVEAFVEQMNQRAAALGLAQSRFANPHGLDAAGHTSSAADLLVLTRQLWLFPRFRTIVATAASEVAGHELRNTNDLLALDERVNGVKTGTSAAAGECLIAGVDWAGRQFFLILLGSRDRYGDLRRLRGWLAATHRWFTPQTRELPALNRLYSPTGELWYLRGVGPTLTRRFSPWQWRQVRVFRRLSLPTAGLAWLPGMKVGEIEWRLGDELLATQTLVLW